MQIATNKQEHDAVIPIPLVRPHQLMSLLELLRFRAQAFYRISSALGQFLPFLHDSQPLSMQSIGVLASTLGELERECKTLRLHSPLQQLARIRELVDSGYVTNALLYQNIGELQNRISDELELQRFIHIPQDKIEFLEVDEPSEDWASSFSEASYDFKEASKCFALARFTACVFHLMRVLEIGLNRLAGKLNVSYDHRNWHNIIEEIEKNIREIGPKLGSEWKDMERVYSGAAVEFRYFKNAWRNHVAHARQRYDEEEALKIFIHVRSFMQHLGTNLIE